MKYGLSEKQLKEIKDIIASYDAVEEAILFGSRAIDTYKEASDIDIAIKGDKADWSLAMTIKDHFEEETYLPFFFDVVAYNSIQSDELRQHIDRKGKALFSRGMCEWRETTLSGVIKLIGGGTPKTKTPEYWSGDIPWLSVVDFNTGKKLVFDTEKKITQTGLDNSSTKLLDAGDIIISARGTVGIVAVLGKEMAFNQSCYGIKAINGKSTNDYIYYLLKDKVSNFLQVVHGGVFDTITKDTFKEIAISLPPLPEQKAIAEVLSSLDDKIDLLHRQNKTLEQMAETLFRQWFVEEAEEDWEETTLGELIKIGSGKGLKKDKFDDHGKYPILGANGKIGRTNKYLFDERLIFTGRVGTLGNIFRVENEKVWLSDNTLVITPKKYYNYIYFFFKNAKLDQFNVGSTQPLIRQSDVKEIELSVADSETHLSFEEECDLLFEKINNNKTQIRTLESLRDTLLPKLMSGEVRVQYNKELTQ